MEETRHSGFTLFELLVTLALVALLAGLAMPAMARFLDNARLGSATEAFSQELQYARNHALTHRQTVYFSVSVSSHRWCYGWSDRAGCDCWAADGDSTACDTGDGDLNSIHRQSSTDFPSIQLDTVRPPASRTIRFSPVRGTASADSFTLRNNTRELRVIVSPLGRVRICSTDAQRFPPC